MTDQSLNTAGATPTGLPPLPDGFTLDVSPVAQPVKEPVKDTFSVPGLPEGFKLDQPSASPVGDFKGVVERGNIDLTKRPKVKMDDGSIATVRSMSFNEDGKEILVPTVSDDGKLLSNDEAIDLYHKTGKHLGVFDNADDATAYAQALHQAQDSAYSPKPSTDAVPVEKQMEDYVKKQRDAGAIGPTAEKDSTALNILKGAGERVFDLFGGFGDLMAATAPAYDPKHPYPYGSGDIKSELQQTSKDIHDVSFGYKPGTTWDDVKNSPAKNFIPFAVEQGLVSAPDMAAVLMNMPGYVAMRTGELGQQRAANDERAEPTVQDMLIAMPAATASALLDKVGAKSMFGLDEAAIKGMKQLIKESGKAAVKEGTTEAAQQGVEDVGTDAGTKKGFDPRRTAENALASAVGGSVFGGVTRGVEGATELATGAKHGKVEASDLPPLPEGFTLDPTIQKSDRLPQEGKQGETVETAVLPGQAPVARDGSKETVSPPDTLLPSISPEERAILRRTSIPDDDIDTMSRPEVDQKIAEAKAANVRVNEAMVRKAAQYQPPEAVKAVDAAQTQQRTEALPTPPVAANAAIPVESATATDAVKRMTDDYVVRQQREAAMNAAADQRITDVTPELDREVRLGVYQDGARQPLQRPQPIDINPTAADIARKKLQDYAARQADVTNAVNAAVPDLRDAVDQSVADENAQDAKINRDLAPLSATVMRSLYEDTKGDGTRQSPVVVQQPAHVDVAAQQVNTEPSEAQQIAGNYKKGHLKVSGIDVTLENPKGSIRSGTTPKGERWQVEMPAHYGYIKKTTSSDGDQVDTYIGDNPQSKRVYVIDQKDLSTRRFDEPKVVMGVNSLTEARNLYARAFSDSQGADRIGGITPMSVSEFRKWLATGDTTRPLAMGKPKVRTNDEGFPIDVKGNIKKPDSLIEFLARKGGVREDTGELTSMGLRDRKSGFVVGAGPLIRRNGMAPDKAREAAAEAGYLSMDSSLKDFYDALDQDARSGRQAFSQYDDDRSARWREEQGGEAKQAEEDVHRTEAYDRLRADGFPGEIGDDYVGRVAAHMANGQTYELAVEQAYQDIAARQPELADIPFFGEDTNETDAGTALENRAPSGAESQRGNRSGDSSPVEADSQAGALRGESGQEASRGRGEQDSGRSDQQSAPQRSESQPQEPVTEPGADNRQQLVIPGAERASDATMAQRGADAALKPKVAQKEAGGLFSDERDQGDLLDLAKKPQAAAEPEAKATTPEEPKKLQPPATVYHGTSTGGFDTFDTYQGKYGLFGTGGYFTEDPNIALEYTRKGKGAAPTVYSAKLNVKNALDMDAKADLPAWEKAFPDYFDASDVPEDATNEQAYRAVEENLSQDMIPDYEGAETMQDGVMSMGYDAITHIGGGRHKASKGTKHRVWIVFDPEQVTNFKEARLDAANPADQATKEEASSEPAKSDEPKAKIEDFGETLHGARKHIVQRYRDALTDDTIDLAAEPLSKSFPAPDYKALAGDGVAPEALAIIALMRDTIPAKPKKTWKLREWVSQVRSLRVFANDILSAEKSGYKEFVGDTVLNKFTGAQYSPLRDLAATAKAISAIDPDKLTQAAKWRVESGSFSMLKGERFNPSKRFYYIKDDKKRYAERDGYYQTEEQAIDRARELIRKAVAPAEGESQRKYTPVAVFQDRHTKEIFVGFKGRREVIRLKSGFEDAKAARGYITDSRDEIQDKIDELRQDPALRREKNDPRIGQDWREGDVTPDSFGETFGFRGVQFGNYVEGPRRQADLNRAYDALMDLADAVGIPPRAISLEGKLGLAFGARGHGGKNAAAAHYEPGNIVINLTKDAGPGSLAHEWMHALDNYFGRQNASDRYVSENETKKGNIRDEVFQAWSDVRRAIRAPGNGGFLGRARKLDEARSKDYYSTTIELAARSFERYIVDRLETKGAVNDYLANIELSGGAYPNETEMKAGITAAYDHLFDTIDTEVKEDGKVRLYSANPAATETPAFKEWFGDSKVVDESGKPLVVYHGTQGEFDAFKPLSWVTEDRDLAEEYADMGGTNNRPKGKRRVIEGYAKIERPFDTDLGIPSVPTFRDLAVEAMDQAGDRLTPNMADKVQSLITEVEKQQPGPQEKHQFWNGGFPQYTERLMRTLGFDGLKFREDKDPGSAVTYAVLDPSQIKSVNNRGTFDPNDARIDYASSPAGWDSVEAMDAKPLLSKSDQKKLADIVRTTAGISPEFVDSIKIPEGGAKGWGNLGTSTAAGAYSPMRDIVSLALDSATKKAAQHESFHRLQNLFLTEKEHNVLKAEEPRLRKMIADNGTYSADVASKMSRKEVEAEAFGIWATAKESQEAAPKLHIALRKVWSNIAKMLDSVRNYLDGRGFQTLEDVFGKAKSGEIAKRPKREAKSTATEYAITDERAPVAEPETKAATPGAAIGTRINDYLKAASKALASKVKSKGSKFDRSNADDGETAAQLAHRKIVDYLSPVKLMQEKAGGNLNDTADAYLTARLAEGTIRHEVHQIDEKYVTPAVDELARVGASLEDLHKFMYAMHAPERNRVVGLRNEEGSDLYKAATDPTIRGASGMSTNEAKDVIREISQDREKFMGIRRAASHIRAMLDNGLETQLKNGLINKETYDRLTQQWQNYVPLRAESDEDGMDGGKSFPSKSRGFDVRGDEFKGATGRFTPADNVVVYAINNAEQSVIRGEKNKAATAALRFVNQFDPKGENIAQVYWSDQPEQLGDITKAPDVYKRVIGSDGKVAQRKVNGFQMRDDVLAAKVGGKTYYMRFADPKVGLALKKMTFSELGVALKMVKTISNWQSLINTRANPAFIPLNLIRDVQTGATLALSKDFKTGEIAKMVGNIPNAWGALWRQARGKPGNGVWDARLRDFMASGGKTSFDQYNSVEETLKKLQKDMARRSSPNKAVEAWHSVIKLVEDLNDTIENGMRLAVFNASRARGETAKRAAFLARDLTVDFQKKGEITPAMNALYTFFNASVQGNFNFAKGLAKSRKVQAAMMGLMAAGFAQHLWNRAMAGNDDDGENAYLKMLRNEPWKFERSMVFFLPGRKDYVMVPLGFGLNAFWHLGMQGGAVTTGDKGVMPAVLDSTRVGFDAFNPLGSGGWVSMALPSIIDPIWELGTNQDFTGKPIYPSENKFDPAPPPKSQQAFSATAPVFKSAAETINKFTGGNDKEPGAVDVYPDSLEYLWGWLTGGVGRFVSQTAQTAQSAVDLNFEPKKTPFVRSFYGSVDDASKKAEYYNEREKAMYAAGKMKEFEDAGDKKDTADFLASHKQELDAARAFKIAEQERKKINKERRSLEKSKMPRDKIDNELDRLNDLELEIMNSARKQYFKAGQPAR
jgi:hypothetical protein